MTCDETMTALRALGTEQIRAIYIRHGAGENQFGVKFGDLGKLAKKIKADTQLARELWATGNSDARMLATMIVRPEELTADEVEAWVRDVTYYGLADVLVKNLASRRKDARALMQRWIESAAEYVAQAGWNLVAQTAMAGGDESNQHFLNYLSRIERTIHTSPNYVRYAMNSAVIAIGLRNAELREAALAAAARIGKVHVDHGETDCKTPDVTGYIRKTLEHRAKKAKA